LQLAFGNPPAIDQIAAETKLSPRMMTEILSGYDAIDQEQIQIFSDKAIQFTLPPGGRKIRFED
jgi:hypothetical protein